MGCAYSVEIKFLHAAYVGNHLFERHYIASVWVNFMAVYAFYEYSFAVNGELSVAHLYCAEADTLCQNFCWWCDIERGNIASSYRW